MNQNAWLLNVMHCTVGIPSLIFLIYFVCLCVLADFDFVPTELASESEKYYTIPRNGDFSTTYRAALQQAIRPASTAGVFRLYKLPLPPLPPSSPPSPLVIQVSMML